MLLCVLQVTNVVVPGVTNVAVNGDKVTVAAPGTNVAASKAGAVGECPHTALRTCAVHNVASPCIVITITPV